jgi:galactoside O-acetyltransferase
VYKGYYVEGPVTAGVKVGLGANATIICGNTIGENSFIGAGSLVTKNVEQNSITYGSPEKFIRKL